MKQALLALLLLTFFGVGVAHVFKPDWFVKRTGVRKGGEMLNEYNRTGFQIAGAVFAAFAAYMLYSLLQH